MVAHWSSSLLQQVLGILVKCLLDSPCHAVHTWLQPQLRWALVRGSQSRVASDRRQCATWRRSRCLCSRDDGYMNTGDPALGLSVAGPGGYGEDYEGL